MSSDLQILSVQVVESTLTGVGRHATDLCEGLLDLGHRVVLFCANARMDRQFTRRLDALLTRPNFEKVDCPMKRSIGVSDIRAIRQVFHYLSRQNHPRMVCHGHSSKGGAVARLAAVRAGVPAIYTPNAISSMNPKATMWKRKAFARLEYWLARRGRQGIIASGQEEFEHMRDFVGVPENRMRIIPNGIARRELPTRQSARKVLGLPMDRCVIGFVGRLASQKGLDVLLDAWTPIRRKHPKALLALIGTGPLHDALRLQANHLGHGDSIAWLGEQPGDESMPAFDLFVLPSRYEGLPYVLMEALAAALPIVVTDKASAGTVVVNGLNGYIVRCEDVQNLASKICELIANDSLRQQFAVESIQRAGLFSVERMVKDVVSFYNDLL